MEDDQKLLDWLEERFSGKWRNSIFLAHEVCGDGMLIMDIHSNPSVVHRAKTVRGAIRLAMAHEQDENKQISN